MRVISSRAAKTTLGYCLKQVIIRLSDAAKRDKQCG
jgi:hypothetical protein